MFERLAAEAGCGSRGGLTKNIGLL